MIITSQHIQIVSDNKIGRSVSQAQPSYGGTIDGELVAILEWTNKQ
ncbi:hypothetical protein CEV31_0882 [Brucella thiophenivorans]|uniref:Uncharacterized protein n=1 Tax=Brucella thiophenivorans TaxID=571255 RepID=A0A256G1D7_9HYPH|nr:hypothetical protein CEV31_0882 [Brucella thiophenivorans]